MFWLLAFNVWPCAFPPASRGVCDETGRRGEGRLEGKVRLGVESWVGGTSADGGVAGEIEMYVQ